MTLFKKPLVVAPEPIGGVDVLRAATKSRRFKGHLARLARDLQANISDLEAFADTGKVPPERVLQALAKEYFVAEWLPETDQLRKLDSPAATPLGLIPEPFTLAPSGSGYPPTVDPKARSGFSPGPPPGKPFPGKRPGWA